MTGQLDLAGFAAAYRADGQGQAPYDPAMMTGLLFYCYVKGIRSSRKIAAACIDDVGCRVICGGAAPSHQAAANFIRRHRPEIKRLFVQVLTLLAAEGAVQGYTAAVDGSPVSGDASRFANLTGSSWPGGSPRPKPRSRPRPRRGWTAPPLTRSCRRATATAMTMTTTGISRLAAGCRGGWRRRGPAGRGPGCRRGVPGEGLAGRPGLPAGPGQERRRLDPGLEPAAGRRPPQILLAAELHDNPADAGALVAMIAAATANCELAGLAARIRAWLADSGYASAAAFAELDHLMLLVAVRNEAAQAGRGDGRQAVPPGWEKMAARLATPAGKRLYARRAALVEPAFAQFFARFGRYVNYRGRDAVDTEIKLLATVHNLAKLLDHRRRHPVPAT